MSSELKTYAWIVGGMVENISQWDGNTDPDTGGLLIPKGTIMALFAPGAIAYIGYSATQRSMEHGISRPRQLRCCRPSKFSRPTRPFVTGCLKRLNWRLHHYRTP